MTELAESYEGKQNSGSIDMKANLGFDFDRIDAGPMVYNVTHMLYSAGVSNRNSFSRWPFSQ